MKKLLLALSLFLIGCSASKVPVKQQSIPVQKPTEIKEVKMDMTLDSLRKGAADLGLINIRALAKDSVFVWLWLADNFNHQEEWIFNQQCDSAEKQIKLTHPFDSLWAIGKLVFHRKIPQGNFNCTSTSVGIDVALTCNWSKITKAAFSDGLNPSLIFILSLHNGYGTGNGGIGVLGLGVGQPSAQDLCYYWIKIWKLIMHEGGHAMGLDHLLSPPYPINNFMSYATNGGCALGGIYVASQQQTILNYYNSKTK